MTESGSEAAQRLTEAFGEPYREVVRGAVEAQQRNVQLAQGWVESVTGVLESQAEANRALTRAMESHTNAVEEAIKSQERTSRALAKSLEAYRDVIERNTVLQEKSTNLVQGFFGDVTSELRRGCRAARRWPQPDGGLGEADGSIPGDAWRDDELLRQPDECTLRSLPQEPRSIRQAGPVRRTRCRLARKPGGQEP